MKRYYDILIIHLAALLLGVILISCFNAKVEVLIPIVASGISLSMGIRAYRSENDKIFKELFTEFNARYDEKFNNKLKSIKDKFIDNQEYELDKEEIDLVIDYLNLCSEEYLWYTKHRIPESVWCSWESGMLYYLRLKPIFVVVKKEMEQKDSFYGLFSRIEKALTEN